MDLYKRFLIFVAAVGCTAAAICGILTAKRNTERRLYGIQEQLPVAGELFSFFNYVRRRDTPCYVMQLLPRSGTEVPRYRMGMMDTVAPRCEICCRFRQTSASHSIRSVCS